MVTLASGWHFTVDRGPDWLFVRLIPPDNPLEDSAGLADELWKLLQQQFVHRLVLEMDQVRLLGSSLLGQLVLLHKRIHTHGGLMRLCGLAAQNADVLRASRLDSRFPNYAGREQAVLGHRPHQPR